MPVIYIQIYTIAIYLGALDQRSQRSALSYQNNNFFIYQFHLSSFALTMFAT